MPTDRHLEVAEIRDFAPGFWDMGASFLMPSEGWQIMEGCRPEPGGGLRACFKPVAWSTTGLTNTATSEVIGLLTFSDSERYLWMRRDDVASITVWSWDGSTWTLRQTHASNAAFVKPRIQTDTFLKSTGVDYVVYTINQTGTNLAVEGVWEMRRDTKAVASVDLGYNPTVLCVMDDRLIVSNGGRILYFSSSGTTTLDHANRFLTVQGSRQNATLAGAIYIAPSDLLVGTVGNVWSLVQGDIATSPTVRSMSDSHPLTAVQDLNWTEYGVGFIEAGVGVFTTSDGHSFEEHSTQLDSNRWVGVANTRSVGSIVMGGNFILAPFGLCLDTRTKSWFTLADLTTAIFSTQQRFSGALVSVQTGVNNAGSIFQYDTKEGGNREDTYRLKTAPYRSQDGRRVRIRQVQIMANFYHVGDAITVTVNGTARTFTATATGFNIVDYLFKEESEYLDVLITANADTTSHEAPAIESIRIGKALAHRSK